jgi:hypothetical protein
LPLSVLWRDYRGLAPTRGDASQYFGAETAI